MLGFIQRPLHKLQAALASERTNYENENYWASVARNVAPVTFEEHKGGKYVIVDGNIYKRTIAGGVPPLGRMNGYPKGLTESFMTRLLELPTQGSQLSISLKFIPISVENIATELEKENELKRLASFPEFSPNPIIEFKDLDWAIKQVKDRPKPLALYVFSSNSKTVDKIFYKISFGGGVVNEAIMHLANSNLPFGGVGNSGMGSYHGKAGFDTFSHHKSILSKSTVIEPPVKYPPFVDWKRKLLKFLIE